MSGFKKLITLCLSAVVAVCMMSVSVFAADISESVYEETAFVFTDVPIDYPYMESIQYLYDEGITTGVGETEFGPELNVTLRQLCVMLCRSLDVEVESVGGEAFGLMETNTCYWNEWISMEAVQMPDTELCRASVYDIFFRAFDIDVYNYELYDDGTLMMPWDNYIRIAAELGLCETNANKLDIMTRGEVAYLLHSFMTNEYVTMPPSLAYDFPIENPFDVRLNPYLLELVKVPLAIRDKFMECGWTYSVDFEYIDAFSKQGGQTYIGACDYGRKTIYVSESRSTVHEFGHFLDDVDGVNFAAGGQWAEHKAAQEFLREYASTNKNEYFAEYFAYFLRNYDRPEAVEKMKQLTPKTYEYFVGLQANSWVV